MKKIYTTLILFFVVSNAFCQMVGTLTVQYVPRIKEQSLGFIYRYSETMGVELNVGYITGYNFFYMRANDSSYKFLNSNGSGVSIRLAPRFISPMKNSKTEFYIEPLFMYKRYSFKDTAYSNQYNFKDTTFYNMNNSYPKIIDGVQKYIRNGAQVGLLLGWQFYFGGNFTASINTGFSLRWQQYNVTDRPYSYTFSSYGASFHLNFGIGYVFLKPAPIKQ